LQSELIGKEIQNIAATSGTTTSVKLCKTTSFTRYSSKPAVLNIKILGKTGTGCSDLINFVFPTAALGAIKGFLHGLIILIYR